MHAFSLIIVMCMQITLMIQHVLLIDVELLTIYMAAAA